VEDNETLVELINKKKFYLPFKDIKFGLMSLHIIPVSMKAGQGQCE